MYIKFHICVQDGTCLSSLAWSSFSCFSFSICSSSALLLASSSAFFLAAASSRFLSSSFFRASSSRRSLSSSAFLFCSSLSSLQKKYNSMFKRLHLVQRESYCMYGMQSAVTDNTCISTHFHEKCQDIAKRLSTCSEFRLLSHFYSHLIFTAKIISQKL